jgi:thioredoxin 1
MQISGSFCVGPRFDFKTPILIQSNLKIGGQEAHSVSDTIVYLTDDSFQNEVLESAEPVLVDYWAEWCGPCKMIAPILDEIAAEHADKLRVVKLDVDANPQTPIQFGVMGIPTLIF